MTSNVVAFSSACYHCGSPDVRGRGMYEICGHCRRNGHDAEWRVGENCRKCKARDEALKSHNLKLKEEPPPPKAA